MTVTVITAKDITQHLKNDIKKGLPNDYTDWKEFMHDFKHDFSSNYHIAKQDVNIIRNNQTLFNVWQNASKIMGFDVLNFIEDNLEKDKEEYLNYLEDYIQKERNEKF